MTRSDAINSPVSSQNCSFASCLRLLVVAGDEGQASTPSGCRAVTSVRRFFILLTPLLLCPACGDWRLARRVSNVARQVQQERKVRPLCELLRLACRGGTAGRRSCRPAPAANPYAGAMRLRACRAPAHRSLPGTARCASPSSRPCASRPDRIEVVRVDLERHEPERLERRGLDDRHVVRRAQRRAGHVGPGARSHVRELARRARARGRRPIRSNSWSAFSRRKLLPPPTKSTSASRQRCLRVRHIVQARRRSRRAGRAPRRRRAA